MAMELKDLLVNKLHSGELDLDTVEGYVEAQLREARAEYLNKVWHMQITHDMIALVSDYYDCIGVSVDYDHCARMANQCLDLLEGYAPKKDFRNITEV